jgi:hypothetical protein
MHITIKCYPVLDSSKPTVKDFWGEIGYGQVFNKILKIAEMEKVEIVG